MRERFYINSMPVESRLNSSRFVDWNMLKVEGRKERGKEKKRKEKKNVTVTRSPTALTNFLKILGTRAQRVYVRPLFIDLSEEIKAGRKESVD